VELFNFVAAKRFRICLSCLFESVTEVDVFGSEGRRWWTWAVVS